MTSTRNIEIMVGLFVATGMAALFMLAMRVSNLSEMNGDEGYRLKAHFENVGGLKVRSPVTMGGVKIGRVARIDYDQTLYEAVVELAIEPGYDRLPKDTSASIYTAGLLGEQYIALEPGGADAYLKDGNEIKLTQPALVLEQVVGQFLFSKAQEGSDSK
ncbi:outer membrane lipid asymmetry maintenance protein MlaD [Endothiovibrio diazotrophicus]